MEDRSAAERLADLPAADRKAILASMKPRDVADLEWDWRFWGRPSQIMPSLDTLTPAGKRWFVWLLLAGRGFGKTRTAVENIAAMLRGPTPMSAPPGAPALLSIIADSPFDMRQYTIEGPSGFLNVGPPDWRPRHEPSNRVLIWPNGARALLFSAEDPETLRGASGEFFWWDELAKSRYAKIGWDNMMYGLREGRPRGIVTTTPRPIPLLKEIVAAESTIITRGSTWANRSNIAPEYFNNVIKPRMGTRLGRQEIGGEILDDIPNALFTHHRFDVSRVAVAPQLTRIVVAVDPSGTKGDSDEGDEIGIIAAGRGVDGHAYVLDDYSCKLSPDGWGRRAVELYRKRFADRIIGEKNFGGAMVEATVRTAAKKLNQSVSYKDVNASRGKIIRAEPISALEEQGLVHMVGSFPALEDQLCMMATNGYIGEGSPDRADAYVHAITELMGDGGSIWQSL